MKKKIPLSKAIEEVLAKQKEDPESVKDYRIFERKVPLQQKVDR